MSEREKFHTVQGWFQKYPRAARIAAATMIATSNSVLPVEAKEKVNMVNPHYLFEQALEGEAKIIGPYGTPVVPGWGAIANGLNEKSDNVDRNFDEINNYLRGLLAGYNGEIYIHADLVFAYGLNQMNRINIVEESLNFAKELYDKGYSASFNIRPPATYTTEDLRNLIVGIYSGEMTYQDGTAIVDKEFIQNTGIPLSLDLEEMANRGYPGGVPGEELRQILIDYRDIMKGYGYEKPVVIIYDMASGEGDHYMTDNVEPLRGIEGLEIVVTFAGFYTGPNQEENLEKKKENTRNLQETYDKERGGCMIYRGVHFWVGDNMSKEEDENYVKSDICAYSVIQ